MDGGRGNQAQQIARAEEGLLAAVERVIDEANTAQATSPPPGARQCTVPESHLLQLRDAARDFCAQLSATGETPERTLVRVKDLILQAVPRDRVDAAFLRSALVSECIEAYFGAPAMPRAVHAARK